MQDILVRWLFYFYFYCFVGWIWETSYVSIRTRHFVNRGFMRGPFLPIYGSGAIVMLFAALPFAGNIPCIFVAGMIGATALEYVTGVVMEKLFKVRYWDYSGKRFNYKGHICLSSTLCWGFFTVLLTNYLHVYVIDLVEKIQPLYLSILTWVLTIGIAADFAISFKAAMELRDLLIQMEKAKEEMARMHKRLDVMLAIYESDLEHAKNSITEGIEAAKGNISEGFETAKDSLNNYYSYMNEEIQKKLSLLKEYARNMYNHDEKLQSEVLEIHVRSAQLKKEHTMMVSLKDFIKRDLIRSNPSMKSKLYDEQLKMLQESVRNKVGAGK